MRGEGRKRKKPGQEKVIRVFLQPMITLTIKDFVKQLK
jgi:hypothetical protein